MNISVIYQADHVIVGGTGKALAEAFRLADRGEQVAMIIRDTFLCTDVCARNRYRLEGVRLQWRDRLPGELFTDNGLLHPDRFKRYLEDQCIRKGIRLFYFMWYLDCVKEGESLLARAASKGGLFGIQCSQVTDLRESVRDLSYQAYVCQGKEQDWSLLRVENAGRKELEAEENLYLCKKALLQEFIMQKQKNPEMLLGRFALRGYESDADIEDGQTGLTENVPEIKKVHTAAVPENIKTESYDIVVAGGGTAGVMAAIYAARRGARTVLVEPNYELGGTGTIGGVNTYWFGRRFREVQEVDQEIERLYRECGLERRPGIWSRQDDFHAGLRGYVYLKLCREAGVQVRLGQLVYGAVTENGRIREVIAAGESGPIIYRGRIILDATGDGDAAVLAGADSVYGNERDLFTYWASLAQYVSPERYKNNFSCMVAAFDPVDYTDFIIQGRKLGQSMFDHGSYVSMRESRHIKGKTCVSLRDLMCFRTYEDGLYTCFSNYDPKGKVTADIVYGGVLPQQTHIQIPLSALIPVSPSGEEIRGLYVLGKAISATHNAFPSIRMQPDLMHQGAVMGIVAAESLKKGILPEDLRAEERRSLVGEATGDYLFTPPKTESLRDMVYRIGKNTRTHWVDVPFTYEEEERNELIQVMCAEAEGCVPLIRERLSIEENAQARRLLILCGLWHGSDQWTEELCQEICSELKKSLDPLLPEREGSVSCVQLLPDHGVMPETVYLLNILAWSQKKCILEPFRQVLDRLKRQTRDYLDIRKGIWHYIEAFAYVAERTGFPEFAPMLKELLGFEELLEPAGRKDLMTDRLGILVLILNRALARLGDLQGYRGLTAMMKQERTTIRLSARRELELLTGERHGSDIKVWEKTLKKSKKVKEIQRVQERFW